MEYGYARASTNSDKQDIGRQKRDLTAIGIKECNIFWEYESGSHENREKLQQLLETVKQGDTIACTEVSRLSRSTKQLCEILEFVEKNKIKLIVGTFVVDCRNDEIDPMTMGMLRMMAVFSQMERDITIQRIKSGMENARAKGKFQKGAIFHSDLGSQYTSNKVEKYLKELELVHSYSKKGYPYDNASMESFNAILKKEEVNLHVYKTVEEARRTIFEFIESWYNRRRIHSSIGYKVPSELENEVA